MSEDMNPNEQNNVFSHNGADADWDMSEDTFTASRPPQYRTQNNNVSPHGSAAVPRYLNNAFWQYYMRYERGVDPRSDVASHTESTVTITADQAEATVAAAVPRNLSPYSIIPRGPRSHVVWHATRDYNGTLQPLTEYAIAALNHSFEESYGDVKQWVDNQRSFSLEEPMTADLSMLDTRSNVTTCTESTAGFSSWTVVSSTDDAMPSHMDDDLRNAGAEFDDVPACTNLDLMDEDWA
ncbi:hypothetical protein F5Y18DRAFT_430804 [Xylariaceae sp. FL1019]|nr:hypothetical protein F5Y18DRAFT_430804 [Xylariaceae sp. FL1019]